MRLIRFIFNLIINIRNNTTLIQFVIFLFLLIIVLGGFGLNELAKNGLYGNECVKAAETAKKSKFSDQLKLLQQNVNTVDENTLKGGTLGGTNDYNNIFADPNLFKNFGGFDNKTEK